MKVIAAAGVSPLGRGWHLASAAATPSMETPLAATHPGIAALACDDRAIGDAVPVRARKTMSRGALLAATAMADLTRALPAGALRDAGCFVGVGASAGAMNDLHAMLGAAIVDGEWSLARFGGPGLAACNPLLAFQLMNNFTMCHAAIQEGIGGPSGALFSRGAGTIAALAAARRSVEDGDCAIAIAGGADSALHPVTWAELVRDGHAVVPGEGCGLIAIADDDRFPALATLGAIATVPLDGEGELAAAIGAAMGAGAEEIVIAVGADANAVRGMVATHAPAARIHDLGLGEALAATPALAWLAALDRIRLGARRVVALTIGVDGDLGVVTLEAP